MTPVARKTPLQPNSPQVPKFGGIKGVRLTVLISGRPKAITRTTMVSLIATMTLLNCADARIPITKSVLAMATTAMAGRFRNDPVRDISSKLVMGRGADENVLGILIPIGLSSSTKYPDQPTAPVDAAAIYSSTRF